MILSMLSVYVVQCSTVAQDVFELLLKVFSLFGEFSFLPSLSVCLRLSRPSTTSRGCLRSSVSIQKIGEQLLVDLRDAKTAGLLINCLTNDNCNFLVDCRNCS